MGDFQPWAESVEYTVGDKIINAPGQLCVIMDVCPKRTLWGKLVFLLGKLYNNISGVISCG